MCRGDPRLAARQTSSFAWSSPRRSSCSCSCRLTLAAYFVTPRAWRNAVLLVASLVFYAWGEAQYLLLVLGSVAFNYLIGAAIARTHEAAAPQALAGGGRDRQSRRAGDLQVRQLRRGERECSGADPGHHAAGDEFDPAAARHLVLHLPRHLVRGRRVQAQCARRTQPAALRALHPAVPAAHRRAHHPLARHRVAAAPRATRGSRISATACAASCWASARKC